MYIIVTRNQSPASSWFSSSVFNSTSRSFADSGVIDLCDVGVTGYEGKGSVGLSSSCIEAGLLLLVSGELELEKSDVGTA